MKLENCPQWKIEVTPTALTLTSDFDIQSDTHDPYTCKRSRWKVTWFRSFKRKQTTYR